MIVTPINPLARYISHYMVTKIAQDHKIKQPICRQHLHQRLWYL